MACVRGRGVGGWGGCVLSSGSSSYSWDLLRKTSCRLLVQGIFIPQQANRTLMIPAPERTRGPKFTVVVKSCSGLGQESQDQSSQHKYCAD